MTGKPRKKREDTFYRDLGRAVRVARIAAGKSQADVAEHLDCSFQQVQKYEKGVNRIPVWELVSLASYFEVPVSSLVESSATDAAFKSVAAKLSVKGFQTLLESWGAIKDQPMRAAILEFVRSAAAFSRR
jgi:transcriptional regulator with XRE-family HTH domain